MFEIPTSLVVGEQRYQIRNDGDYRTILDCFLALGDEELTAQERLFACLIIFYNDLTDIESVAATFGENLEEAVEKMYNFFKCGVADGFGKKSNYKLIDWEQDAQLICSAINKVAGVEVRAVPYMHWWTFMGHYSAVGESPLSTIISIRDKIIKGKKLEKYEREFRTENPEYFTWKSKTVDDLEADKLVKELWNSGGE